ncbi:hypothetical protein, partial [Lactobacillus crispatus]|uniref:hypothetical protein n=1 Tax=Lactobacillus crispatus TaxID=47770 RepID=UPI0022E36A21
IVKIVSLLVKKNALKIDYPLTFFMEKILFQMHNRQYSDLISKLLSISKTVSLPDDQKKLQKTFLS